MNRFYLDILLLKSLFSDINKIFRASSGKKRVILSIWKTTLFLLFLDVGINLGKTGWLFWLVIRVLSSREHSCFLEFSLNKNSWDPCYHWLQFFRAHRHTIDCIHKGLFHFCIFFTIQGTVVIASILRGKERRMITQTLLASFV